MLELFVKKCDRKITYCKMFIKYALTPLRMDKKKYRKNTRPNMAPEKLPGGDLLFFVSFFVSIQ